MGEEHECAEPVTIIHKPVTRIQAECHDKAVTVTEIPSPVTEIAEPVTEIPKKRGRPPSGKAMSSTERQKRFRARKQAD